MNEGVPVYRDPFVKGQLIIQFTVTFPRSHWTSADNLEKLEALLPPKERVVIRDGMEEVTLHE